MNTSYVVFSMLAGWCGTPWRWPKWPFPPFPGPTPPDPGPWPWLIAGVISVIGGLAGGFLVARVFPSEVSLTTISIGAFIGGRVIGDLYGMATVGARSNER
jgi:hypothetical protein